ncbi:MAG: 16S rRNA (uracil(1498)-N(3))-methyltransferase [Treponema sp.]|nr:16S rRNA (uracil(1498)-N(3))-methyltransferase [Treponema sp.]
MKQFMLPAPPDRDGLVRVSGADFHYLIHVRRLKQGDRFRAVLPGADGEFTSGDSVLAEVAAVGAGTLTAVIAAPGERRAGDPGIQPPVQPSGALSCGALPPILLFQALPKGSKMDLIVRQAAEGALSEVVPFVSERSAIREKDARRGEGEKPRRWERIIREALQQSGSPVFTVLRPVLDWDGLFAYWNELRAAHPRSLGIFLHQDPAVSGDTPLAEANLHWYLSNVPGLLALAVGPEGGFSPGEVSRFAAEGFKPLKIGNTVLRVETAALYGAAAARVILLEHSSWTGNG